MPTGVYFHKPRGRRPKEVVREYKRRWARLHRNREKDRGWNAIFRERNPEYQRKHRLANRDKYANYSQNRRARIRRLLVERVNRQEVFSRDNGICWICKSSVDPSNWHLDHKIPISLGGLHCYDNVAVSHPKCNITRKRSNVDSVKT